MKYTIGSKGYENKDKNMS